MYFMKTNGTRPMYLFFSLILVSLLITISGMAQPDYAFRNAKLISGTNLQAGAVYSFKNVRPGTDALVTITTVSKVTLTNLDGGSGFDEAFQPVIYCPRKTKGYVEFRFDFVYAGTTNPQVMTEVPVTAIDIDGYIYPDEKVYEFDEFDITPGYYIDYDKIGSSLDIKVSGVDIKAVNKTAADYSGIDTVQRDVMFTMVYSSVSSITIRAGVDNKSKNDVTRLRSDYFMKFTYPNSYLAKSPLQLFRGTENNNKVNLLWQLENDNQLSSVVIERATSPNQFYAIGEVWPNADVAQVNFAYTDNNMISGQAYYRLKLVAPNGTYSYSNILVFRSANGAQDDYKVYPSIVQSAATVSVKSDKNGTAIFRLVDYSGKVVMQQQVNLQEGVNNVVVNNLQSVNTGNYVAVIKTADNKIHSQKIFKK